MMKLLSFVPLSILAAALSLTIGVWAQDDAPTTDEKIQIQSAILKQSRSLVVHRPSGYAEDAERYPVLYLLDGQEYLQFTAAIADFLAEDDRIPRLSIVAIDSGDFKQRAHDLTTPSQADIDNRFQPGNGGAEAFLSFISDELVPYVDKKYRTRPYRILVGHSLGGLFAVHTLVSKPKLFNAYISIDPTLSWNGGKEMSQAEAFFRRVKNLQADFFMAAANQYGDASPDIRRFAASLDQKVPEGFHWKFEWMKGETHSSIPLLSTYAGLATIFDGWHLIDPLLVDDHGGLEAIQKHFHEGGERCGYERTASPFTISLVVAGLINAGRFEEAATVLLHDRERYPPPWNQLDALGRAYADRGDRGKAIRYFEMSLKENPQNGWAKQKLKEMGVPGDGVGPDQNLRK